MMAGAGDSSWRPAGPSARTGAAAYAAKPGRAEAWRPAFEGQDGEAVLRLA